MKKTIKDIYTLLSVDTRLKTDGVDTIAVKTFREFNDPLVMDFPAVMLERVSKDKQIKSMPSGYLETFSVDIVCVTTEYGDSDNGSNMLGYDRIDTLTNIVEKILQENPKIDGSYLDSDITSTRYEAGAADNYIFYSAIISLTAKRRVLIQR
ncbi:MAG TPA: hypothetical protein PKK26_03810 [Candidatus Wallbacteria bacterium]|nr:hypothetical protein [Candidatus Wallbacteria bacterium]